MTTVLPGCSPTFGALRWSDVSDISLPYKRVLEKWTRTAAAYEGLETRFAIRTTCFSPGFVDAWARERASRADLLPREADDLQQTLMRRATEELRFFLVLETREPHWDDLADRKPSLKVRLFHTDGDSFIEPTRIVKIADNEMADLRVLFPYARVNATGYWITFEHQAEPSTIRLQVGGTPASLDLIWSMTPVKPDTTSLQ